MNFETLPDIPVVEVAEGRLERSSGTVLVYQRYVGDTVTVAGERVPIGSAGMTRATTDNRIDGTGADAGAALTSAVLYYVYVSGSGASFSPKSIRCSTVAPTLVNGVYYLGASGNALNWRFLGMVFTDGATNFQDNVAQRWVSNYYNRIWRQLYQAPAINNNDADTTYTLSAGSWGRVNGGTNDSFSFIANGEDVIRCIFCATVSPGASGSVQIGIGRNSTTSPTRSAAHQNPSVVDAITVTEDAIFSRGVHTAYMLAVALTATATFYADRARNGAASDPPATYMTALVPV